MKTGIAATLLILAFAAVAFLQFSAAVQLREDLALSEAARQLAEAQRGILEEQQQEQQAQHALFEQQIATLQDNLDASSRQLEALASALQDARALLPNAPAAATADTPASSPQ